MERSDSRKPLAERLRPLARDRRVLIVGCLVLAAVMVYLAYLPLDLEAQTFLGFSLFVILLVLRKVPRTRSVAFLFLTIAAFLNMRYFFWRTLNTVVFTDPASYIGSVALYLAETYGIILYAVSLVLNSNILERKPVPLEGDPSEWPTVDIMVPSYNEAADLLEITLTAAKQMRYPQEKFEVHLLDDGSTEQKRSDSDAEAARIASERYIELQALCERLGVRYHTREKNVHAKAGNINAALPSTSNDLILIFDADHVPTSDFLEKTVGWFQRDPKMFLVQTTHFFLNPDPIEKNLDTFDRMPSEGEMFYSVIQRGMDFWNSSFFCGSGALLRRVYLEEIGGVSGVSITEDAETALELHCRGYNSAFIERPMLAGQQPQSFGAMVIQRTRWAQGMMQIFVLKNPVFRRGLTLGQRLGYFNSSFYWLFSFARIVFITVPAYYLLFGLQIYHAHYLHFFGYGLPHVAAAYLVSNYLFGHTRWTLFSELYETMQSFFCSRGLVQVFLNPRSPRFGVTPKAEPLERDYVSPYVPTFYFLTLLMVVSLIAGVYRFQIFPQERGVVLINLGWAIFNLMILIGALGAMYERAQRRAFPRVRMDMRGTLEVDGQRAACEVIEMSIRGVGLRSDWRHAELLSQARRGTLTVLDTVEGKPFTVGLEFRNRRFTSQGLMLGAAFVHSDPRERWHVVRLIYGDSERWVNLFRGRQRHLGVFQGMRFFLGQGLKTLGLHAYYLLSTSLWGIGRAILAVVQLPFRLLRGGRRPAWGERI